jgi:chromate transporter
MTRRSETDQAPTGMARLREVALLFLRLGCTAFGGPAAHVGIMEDEIVRRRGWVSREQFLDLLGAVNLIPGPNSTEMAIHIGFLRAGWPGLVAAGCAFILPAAVLVTAMAWVYIEFSGLPHFDGLLYGMKPVVIAIIAQALWRLGRTAMRTRLLALVAVLGAVAGAFGLGTLTVLIGGGLAVGLAAALRQRPAKCLKPVVAMLLVAGCILAIAYGLAPGGSSAGGEFGMGALFLYFLKIGSVLYGTGYVLLAFLQTDLVPAWVTDRQLADAMAVGQVTPGPLFTTATFIGYLKGYHYDHWGLVGGLTGAAVATVAIFLPAFLYVAVSGLIVPRLKKSPVAKAFLEGVTVTALALMVVVTWKLGQEAVCPRLSAGDFHRAATDVPTVVLALGSLVLLLRWRVNSAWLILGGAAAGLGLVAAGIGP